MRRGEEALETVKLALDVWYELWENAGSEGSPGPQQPTEEVDPPYPWLEDNLAWDRGTRPRSVYYERCI